MGQIFPAIRNDDVTPLKNPVRTRSLSTGAANTLGARPFGTPEELNKRAISTSIPFYGGATSGLLLFSDTPAPPLTDSFTVPGTV